MTDTLPPLPELPPPEVEEWSETFITLRGEGWKKETVEKYATDYARAAIERQSVPAGSLALDAAIGYIERHTPHLVYSEIKAALASAPQPQPERQALQAEGKHPAPCARFCEATAFNIKIRGLEAQLKALAQPQPVPPEGPMAETVEEAARDVAKCLNERDGQGLDLRHVAMLVHYAQQPVQQPVAWSERIKELADQYAIECVEFSKGIPNGAHSMSPIAVKAGDTRLALHSAIDTAERLIRAIESATLAAQVERATQPQPVQEQCPECDGTGTVSGSQAHFLCPLCTSPQAAQPLSDEQAKKLCAVGPVYAPDGLVERTGQEYRRELEAARLRGLRDGEQAHGITKGTA